MSVQVQNNRGEWVPAIPIPYFKRTWRGKVWCQCGRGFRFTEDYRGHYALVHILGLD